MDKPLLRAALIAATLALAACGNKGPLVRMPDEPPPVPVEETAPLGLVPFLQAQLLARHLRGDLDAYPPWFWK